MTTMLPSPYVCVCHDIRAAAHTGLLLYLSPLTVFSLVRFFALVVRSNASFLFFSLSFGSKFFSCSKNAQGDKIASILKAADIEFEAFWPNLFAKAVGTKDIGALIFNIGSGGGGAPAPAAGGAVRSLLPTFSFFAPVYLT